MPKLLDERPYKGIIVLTPSNNITNSDKMPSDEQNQMALQTPLETLAIVEKALKDYPTVEKAVIVELPPRADSSRLAELSEFSNFVLKGAVAKSRYNNQISVASLDSLYDYNNDDIFGNPSSTNYERIHMRGKFGSKVYTDSILTAVWAAGLCKTNTTTTPTTTNGISTSNRYQTLSN